MQSECRAVRVAVVGRNLQDRIGLDKSAAAELHVSGNTISFHMRRAYEKRQVTPGRKLCPRRWANG